MNRIRAFGSAVETFTGLEAGQQGLECAIFRSDDGGQSFTKVHSWSKTDLSYPERKVLSIEGTALHQRDDGSEDRPGSNRKRISRNR